MAINEMKHRRVFRPADKMTSVHSRIIPGHHLAACHALAVSMLVSVLNSDESLKDFSHIIDSVLR